MRRDALLVVTSALAFALASVPPLAGEEKPAAAIPKPQSRPDDVAVGTAERSIDGNGSPVSGADQGSPASGDAGEGAASERAIADIPLPRKRPAAARADKGPAPSKRSGMKSAKPGIARPADPGGTRNPLKAREVAITPAAAVRAAAAVEDAKRCEAELKERGVVFTVGESISEGACGVLRPVNIQRLSSGVAIPSGTKLLCRTALALDTWMSQTVIPAARANFPADRLTEFRQASTYVCRRRASENGISEHARGSAIDIASFVFDDGRRIGVERQSPSSPQARFQKSVRDGACGPFKTVLGPGTDGDHATHFHLDMAARRNGATYCK